MHGERSVHEQVSWYTDWRTERLEEEVLQHLRGAILHKDREVLIINKPAGLPVQGGDAISVSVDSLLPQLTFGASERPRCSPGPPSAILPGFRLSPL
jgi:23S rRNA-/tRNA-specific pseudouridylate synthase